MISIRRNLLAWLLSGLFLLLLLAGVASYVEARGEIDELFDYQIRQIANSFRRSSLGSLSPRQAPNAQTDDDFVVQVWDANGTLLWSTTTASPLPMLQTPGFGDIVLQNETWRAYLTKGPERTVQAAQAVSLRHEMSVEFALRNVLPTLLLIPALAAMIWLGVGRGLRPLQGVAVALGRRNPRAMDPLPEMDLPREVKPMVTALNDLLGRLGIAMATQREFVADAAHELRTPLTALRLQSEILERTTDERERSVALADLKNGLERMSQLVQQLLTLARLDPEEARQVVSLVDLGALAKKAVTEHALMAEAAQVDLGMACHEPAKLLGDADKLGLALNNLLSNSIRYTRPGGKVDVSVWERSGGPVLEVVDTGVGIPAEERGRVFDRFYRSVDNDKPGSGLGLAIVKKIVDLHRGTITLEDGNEQRGLRVTVSFPRP